MRKVWIGRFHCYEGLSSVKGHELYLISVSCRDWNLTRKFHMLLKLIPEAVTVALQHLTLYLTTFMATPLFHFSDKLLPE